MQSTERIALLLSLAQPTSAETTELRVLARDLSTKGEWPRLLELLKLNCIEAKALAALKAHEIAVPEPIEQALRSAREKIEAQNGSRIETGLPVLRALVARGCDVVILKGNYLAGEVYADPYYKKMNDIDILVRKRDLDAVHDIFQGAGLLSAAALSNESPRAQEKYSHHWPPFFTPDLKCVFGTHWGLASPLSGVSIDYDKIWSRVIPFEFHGLPAFTLEPTDLLHHLCFHLPPYKTGLRELGDIYNFIRTRRAEIDWGRLVREAIEWKTVDRLYYTLSLVQALDPSREARAVLLKLEPLAAPFTRRETAVRVATPERILVSRSTQISKIEKAYALFSLARRPQEKAYFLYKMWRNFLAPKPAEVRKMNNLPENAGALALLKAYGRNPALISRVFAQDMGWNVFVLITLRHHVDLMRSVGESAVSWLRLAPPPALEDVFRAMGIRDDAIENMEAVLE
ncbi:MAG TPA: nucleotidyltransferase family protein [Bdellovibrionales bacterium]|nr:nucleotidyltransferase family protein [Bdellovibrionales bacterium]